MTEIKIEDIEANYQTVFQLVGQESFVNWDAFTKSSTQLKKEAEDLSKQLNIFRDVQQKRFVTAMKQLKGYDIPDLIKTVKSKKLPRQTLKTILNRFKLQEGKLTLVDQVQKLKEQSKKALQQYVQANEELQKRFRESSALIKEKIAEAGIVNQVSQVEPPKQLVSTFKHTFDESLLEIAATGIPIEYLPGTVNTLHIKTYAQIVERTHDLIKSQYKRLTFEWRVKQRSLRKEPKKYIETLIEYLTNTEVLVIEGQKAIAGKLGISPQKMEETENTLMEKGLAQNLLMIQSALRTRVKESMAPEKETPLELSKEILKFQVTELQNRTPFFKELFSTLEKTPENFQLIPMLLALALNDLVYEKYQYEEEDFMKNVGDNVIMTNPEIMNIFKDMELAIIKLMQELEIISPQAGRMMQAQSQMPPGQIPQYPNGLQPGVNPMELLQMQQFEQFQRLQRQMGGK